MGTISANPLANWNGSVEDGRNLLEMPMPDLEPFIDAIKRMHGCDCVHVQSVTLTDKTPDGRTLWDGTVEVFDLRDFPKASRCYVWIGSREGQYVVVLHSEKIDSPMNAVRSRLVMGSKRHD